MLLKKVQENIVVQYAMYCRLRLNPDYLAIRTEPTHQAGEIAEIGAYIDTPAVFLQLAKKKVCQWSFIFPVKDQRGCEQQVIRLDQKPDHGIINDASRQHTVVAYVGSPSAMVHQTIDLPRYFGQT